MKPAKLNRLKKFLFLPALLCLTVSFFGAGIGTYAWYLFQSISNIGYSGTAVSRSKQLEIGLIAKQQIHELETVYGLYEEHMGGQYYYWSNTSSLGSGAMSTYAEEQGYASNQIYPTTSGEFKEGDYLSLKSSPTCNGSSLSAHAGRSAYSVMEFIFRLPNPGKVILKTANLSCSNDIKKAVRLFINPPIPDTGFLFAPAMEEDGYTEVGGYLNLNSNYDSYYDYDTISNKELVYGEVDNLEYDGSLYEDPEILDKDDCDCFTSNHKIGVQKPSFIARKAEYYGRKSIINKKVLATCTSQNLTTSVMVAVFLEGWDHTCTDQGVNCSYSLNLEFGFLEDAIV